MEGCVFTLPFSGILRQFGGITCAALLLAACSSGGGDGGTGGGGGTSPTAMSISGTFIDSPVDGLHYTTTSNPGGSFTSSGGHFQCQPGDLVTFWVGRTQIGSPQFCSSDVVTAVSVLGASNVTDPAVVDLAQLLMTLAGTNISSTLIKIPQPLPTWANNPLPVFGAANFDSAVQAALPNGTMLVTDSQAKNQLRAALKLLTVTIINGGTVTSTPTGINCIVGAGSCSSVFQAGAVVTLTAIGTGFTGWSGGTGSVSCTGTDTCSITLDTDSSVTATFPGAPPPSTLSVTTLGGGTIMSDPAGINCGSSCSAQFLGSSSVTLTATADPGSTFTGWSNSTGSVICSGTDTCSMTLNADSTVTASFTLNVTQFSVTAPTASANAGGGTVQCNAGPCSRNFPVGTSISIVPTADIKSNFTGWTNGNGSGLTANCGGTTGPCNFQLTSDTNIMANFNRPILRVVVNGNGSASSNPAGINTCTTNCLAPFDKGTVTLTATADPGSTFTGWSGGCSGPSPTCLVTLTDDTTVTALFSTAPPPGTQPIFITEVHSATDIGTVGVPSSTATLSLNVSGTNTLLLSAWHAEYDGDGNGGVGFPDGWTVTNNGVPGTEIVDTDGYTGGAGNRRFRIYYWLNPPPGTNTVVVTNPHANDTRNELAVSVVLLGNVAQDSPLGAIKLDVSTLARTGESETVSTTTNDLIVHVIADALYVRGTLGPGETSRSVANDGGHQADGDASLWISTKPGELGSTTVSSSGWASRVINGAAIVVHGP